MSATLLTFHPGEIIPLLYGANIFHFQPIWSLICPASLEHFLAFTHSIPDARWDSLRHLRLKICLTFSFHARRSTYFLTGPGEYRWKRMCDTLKRASSLSTLVVDIKRAAYRTGNWQDCYRRSVCRRGPENRLLRHLIGVRAKKRFVVQVPWTGKVVGELPDATFQIQEKEGALTDVVDKSLEPPTRVSWHWHWLALRSP